MKNCDPAGRTTKYDEVSIVICHELLSKDLGGEPLHLDEAHFENPGAHHTGSRGELNVRVSATARDAAIL